MTTTYLAMNIDKSVAAKYLRCDRHSIIRCISRVRQYLEPDVKNRYEGVVNIGIDETSYKKGHSYLTVVVNHDTNTVVWCGVGHSMEVLSQFFEELTEKQQHSIKFITGDGAKWIDACMKKKHSTRHSLYCSFSCSMLGKDTLDSLRKETWYKAHRTVQNINEVKVDHQNMTKNLMNFQ